MMNATAVVVARENLTAHAVTTMNTMLSLSRHRHQAHRDEARGRRDDSRHACHVVILLPSHPHSHTRSGTVIA